MKNNILLAAIFLVIITCINITSTKADQGLYPTHGQIKIIALDPYDNWIKLYNTGNTPVDLAGWVFYDESDDHEYFITLTNLLGGKLILNGYEETLINVKEDSDFRLKREGMELRLYNGPVEIEGELIDQINYPKLENGESYEVISNIKLPVTNEISNENTNKVSDGNTDEISSTSNKNEKIPAQGRDDPVPQGYRESNKKEFPSEWRFSRSGLYSPSTSSRSLGMTTDKTNINEEKQDSNKTMKQFNNENKTFTASSPLEKSPYALAYRLWNNWFLRRIILPFFILWAGLFAIAYFVRKKYLS